MRFNDCGIKIPKNYRRIRLGEQINGEYYFRRFGSNDEFSKTLGCFREIKLSRINTLRIIRK